MSPEDIHKLGALVLVLGIVPLVAAEAGWLRGAWTQYVLPGALLALGAFLILDPIVFHGGSFGAEGVQHQLQGAAAVALAVVEVLIVRGTLTHRLVKLLLPVGVIAIGVVFVIHSQHAGMAMRAQLGEHRMLGVTIIAMGLVLGIERGGWARGNWARVGWLVLALVVSAQLFVYGEDTLPTTAVPAGNAGGHGGH